MVSTSDHGSPRHNRTRTPTNIFRSLREGFRGRLLHRRAEIEQRGFHLDFGRVSIVPVISTRASPDRHRRDPRPPCLQDPVKRCIGGRLGPPLRRRCIRFDRDIRPAAPRALARSSDRSRFVSRAATAEDFGIYSARPILCSNRWKRGSPRRTSNIGSTFSDVHVGPQLSRFASMMAKVWS